MICGNGHLYWTSTAVGCAKEGCEHNAALKVYGTGGDRRPGSRLLRVVIHVTEDLLAESDEVLGAVVVGMVRSQHEHSLAKERGEAE